MPPSPLLQSGCPSSLPSLASSKDRTVFPKLNSSPPPPPLPCDGKNIATWEEVQKRLSDKGILKPGRSLSPPSPPPLLLITSKSMGSLLRPSLKCLTSPLAPSLNRSASADGCGYRCLSTSLKDTLNISAASSVLGTPFAAGSAELDDLNVDTKDDDDGEERLGDLLEMLQQAMDLTSTIATSTKNTTSTTSAGVLSSRVVTAVTTKPPPTEKKEQYLRFALAPHATRLVPSLDDMSPSEICSLWNQEEDSRRFESDIIETVRAFRLSSSGNNTVPEDADGSLCKRGIEYMLSGQTMMARKQRMKGSVRAVLTEQSRQRARLGGKYAIEGRMLRNAYLRHVGYATEVALASAAMDEAYALREAAGHSFND